MKVIIVGAGEVGYNIAQKLSWENKDVVVIEKDETRLRHVADTLDVQTLLGSGSSPALLKEAGLSSADIFIAATDSDEANLVACMVSRILSPGTDRIARVRNSEFSRMEEFKEKAGLGLSLLINPENEVVETILKLMEVPGAVDVIDFAGGLVRLIGLKISHDSNLAGLNMIQLRNIDPENRILIAAIHRDSGVIIPRGKTELRADDLVYVVTRPDNVGQVLNFFGMRNKPVRSVFIVGGGQVGTALAERLEQNGKIKVKLIDRDGDRCERLGQLLHKTIVLKGDGTDQSLLLEENVANANMFVSVTNDEEENVLSCLLAKRLGAEHTITRVNKSAYIPLVSAIGLETMVSSRLSAVSTILRNIRRGKVVSVVALKGEDAEVIEFEALDSSDVVGPPLMDIKFPNQALIAAIVRDGEVIIPRGDTVIRPKDHLIVFTRREALGKVEKAISVNLEYF